MITNCYFLSFNLTFYIALVFLIIDILFILKINKNPYNNFISKISIKTETSKKEDKNLNITKNYFILKRVIFLFVDYVFIFIYFSFEENYIAENKQYFLIKFIYLSIIIKNLVFFFFVRFKIHLWIIIHILAIAIMIMINIKIPFLTFKENILNNDLKKESKDYVIKNIFIFSLQEIFFEMFCFWIVILFKNSYNLELRNHFIQKFINKKSSKISNDIISGMNGFHLSYYNKDLIFISENFKKFLINFLNLFWKKDVNNNSIKNMNLNHSTNANFLKNNIQNPFICDDDNFKTNQETYTETFLKNMKNTKNDKFNLFDFIEFFTYQNKEVVNEKEIDCETIKFKEDNKLINIENIKNITFKINDSILSKKPNYSNNERISFENENSKNNQQKEISKRQNFLQNSKNNFEEKNKNIVNDNYFNDNMKNNKYSQREVEEEIAKNRSSIIFSKIGNNRNLKNKENKQVLSVMDNPSIDNSDAKFIINNSENNKSNYLNSLILDKQNFIYNKDKNKENSNECNTNFFGVLKYLKSEKLLDINFQNIYNTPKDLLEENKEKLQKFKILGEFYTISGSEEKFFLVYFRKIENTLDFFLYEITKIKIAENISTENKVKHKILSKIAHEFKTPLNSILSLIKNLKEINYNKNINKDLNLIQSLSNYTIYLISDVIQYASNESSPYSLSQMLNFSSNRNQFNNSLQENNFNFIGNNNMNNEINLSNKNSNSNSYMINTNGNFSNNNNINFSSKLLKSSINFSGNNLNLINRKIEIRKTMFFCFDILNALLSCHENKKRLIKTELHIENIFNNFEIINDEIRVNQIILNLISNSVKFTKKGKIAIVAQFIRNKDFLVKDKRNNLNIKEKGLFNEKYSNRKHINQVNDSQRNSYKFFSNREKNTYMNINKNYNDNLINENEISDKNQINTDNEYSLKISVIDTGMGISEINQKLIFTDKLRLNTKYEFNQQGSGLGLSICMKLVKSLNVKIELFSEINKGSVFSLIIPAKKIKEDVKKVKFQYNNNNPNGDSNKKTVILEENKNCNNSQNNNIFPLNENSNRNNRYENSSENNNNYFSYKIQDSETLIGNNSFSNNINNNFGNSSRRNANKAPLSKIRTIEEINNSQEKNNSSILDTINNIKLISKKKNEFDQVEKINKNSGNKVINKNKELYNEGKALQEIKKSKNSEKTKYSNFYRNQQTYCIESNIESKGKNIYYFCYLI